jgi:hypothetical protein
MQQVADTARDGFLLSFPKIPIENDTVVLSMRGGDVFEPGSGWTCYWQPPCFFYSDVQRRFKNSIVVASDRINPCVDLAIENGAVFHGADYREDFARLAWAEHVVLGRSSFARASLYMSGVPKDFYVFEGDSNSINGRWNSFWSRYLEHGDHWDCRASQRYREWLIGNWSATADQVEFLLRDKCTWTRARWANRSWEPLPPSEHDVGQGYSVFM